MPPPYLQPPSPARAGDGGVWRLHLVLKVRKKPDSLGLGRARQGDFDGLVSDLDRIVVPAVAGW